MDDYTSWNNYILLDKYWFVKVYNNNGHIKGSKLYTAVKISPFRSLFVLSWLKIDIYPNIILTVLSQTVGRKSYPIPSTW